ncbi:C40 family peptidase [Methylibium petroleiphilum]|uniref:Cell wall-associated hydrolase-like protein n=1 Tax=Methylibium petroleiphilum (strain ATCC BAA-1232 / LMG 22953 / PM1) TaxID=420662 RepID=A2SIT5_METPP|nr:C40 family peptidase [Methylibium petroleiphilum]ABM95474.1 cell wall-associated hydrolase-like protein [Methylibium petroleiphilum PM1]
MIRLPRSLRPPLASLCLALCLAGTNVQAEPGATDSAPDSVARFLAERGLIEPIPADSSFAQQVRERAADWTSDLVLSAMNFLGVRYRRGGETAEQGFDCSGFTRHVFEASVGLVLPRRSNEQAKAPGLLNVNRDELKPGDLVFFNTLRTAFSHVGIYVGDGKFIHAPRTGGKVRVEDMRVAYWSKRYDGARRAPQPAETAVTASPASTPAVAATALASPLASPGH